MTQTAKEILKTAFGGSKNFMTPNLIKIGKIDLNTAYEITTGTGFNNSSLYGVIVIRATETGTKHLNEYSKSFDSLQKAEDYIKEIKATWKADKKAIEKAETEKPIIEELKRLLGQTKKVYCVLKYRSSSGMNRVISFHTIKDNELYNLDYNISKILNYSYSDSYDGLKVDGCGMDMGFSVVYNLSAKLYKNHERAGYILRHNWI